MGGHYNKLFNRKVLNPLTKDGFSCLPTSEKNTNDINKKRSQSKSIHKVTKTSANKYWIRKGNGPQYLVHSGNTDKLHDLRRFLKNQYQYILNL